MTHSSKPSQDAVNRVFGDAFAEVSADEREPNSPEDDADRERWLWDNVPPHHD